MIFIGKAISIIEKRHVFYVFLMYLWCLFFYSKKYNNLKCQSYHIKNNNSFFVKNIIINHYTIFMAYIIYFVII
jgi:hypothetical protein